MEIRLFSFWYWAWVGFSILEIDVDREDEVCCALFGLAYNTEDKAIGVDLFWRYFEIKLSNKEPVKFDFENE